jgi:VanZ family protein
VQPRIPALPIIKWLLAWWPALVWSAVIFGASTDTFSSEHTSRIIEPLLRWLYPAITAGQFELVHHLIRKCAHLTEYFIYGLLLYRGVRLGRKGWRWSWGISVVFIAAIYACLDEIHQAFVASRTASPYDSLLDTIGASCAMLCLYVYFRRRKGANVTPA